MTQYECMLLELDILQRLECVIGDTFDERLANAIHNLEIDIEHIPHERSYIK